MAPKRRLVARSADITTRPVKASPQFYFCDEEKKLSHGGHGGNEKRDSLGSCHLIPQFPVVVLRLGSRSLAPRFYFSDEEKNRRMEGLHRK
jgi:hypothetical protein